MEKKWTDTLTEEIYNRLCNCRSTKKDILPLAQSRWNFIKGNKNFDKEDALVYILELLDSNSCEYDLTIDEYKDILAAII